MRRFEEILHGGLYRSRNGVILGVCKGIAEYFDFSTFWVRAIAIGLLIFSGFWPVTILYFIAALLMKPKPAIPIDTDEEQEFYDSYVHSRKGAVDRLKRRYDNLEHRVRRMEDTVTSREYNWDRKINT
jgi:phage shock protein C